MKRLIGALLLSVGLLLGGCGMFGQSATVEDPSAKIDIDVNKVRNGKPEYDGWIDGAVEFVKENDREEGVLVEVTGLITKGYEAESITEYSIVDPSKAEESNSDDPYADAKFPSNAAQADVYLIEPVEPTRWTHLTSVRGMAFLDKGNPNKIIIRGAIEVD